MLYPPRHSSKHNSLNPVYGDKAHPLLSALALSALLLSSLAQAEIYKWVDEKGQVHYSDLKSQAKKAKVETIHVEPSLNLIPEFKPSETLLRPKAQQENSSSEKNKKANSRAHKKQRDKLDHRCTLARQIINGEVVLTNGLPTGQYEIEVAKRDIEKFCP